MVKREQLERRGWAPILHKKTGKFYGGVRFNPSEFESVYEEPHKTQIINLYLKRHSQSRTSATLIFVDPDGFEYETSLAAGVEIVQKIMENPAAGYSKYVPVEVAQVKRGKTIKIELVED